MDFDIVLRPTYLLPAMMLVVLLVISAIRRLLSIAITAS
jgi:hypothetical protein